MTCPVFARSVDASLSRTLLPAVISLTAGSVDVISFLGLGGLFTDYRQPVILASHIVNAGEAPVASTLITRVASSPTGLDAILPSQDPSPARLRRDVLAALRNTTSPRDA
jgi:hypothetical protein